MMPVTTLAYDLRNFSLSSDANGGIGSSGIFESRDVIGSLRYVRSREDLRNMTIGMFSRCLGCNSTLYAMKTHPEAAGGVGHFAVQLAKWKGARVIAVAKGAQESFLRELGADEFIDYTKAPAENVAHDVDLVFDTVGGPTTGRFLRTIRHGGALFPVFPGFSDAEEAKKLGVIVSMTQVRSNGPQLAELGRSFAMNPFGNATTPTERLSSESR